MSASDTITSSGFIIAGNNTNGTKGVSNTTLTGRQWGIAPRVGFAWQPSYFPRQICRPRRQRLLLRSRRVVHLSLAWLRGRRNRRRSLRLRSDRSPLSASSTARIASSYNAADPTYLYLYYIPICGGNGFTNTVDNSVYNLATPWGTHTRARPPIPKPPTFRTICPTLPPSSMAPSAPIRASLLRWASTTAPTSCPTASTSR